MMSRSNPNKQERRYTVTTPDGVTRIISTSYPIDPSLLCPDRAVSTTSYRQIPTQRTDSGYQSQSNTSQPRGSQTFNNSQPRTSQTPSDTKTTCFGKPKKTKPNRQDAYVYMDNLENRAIILDDGKPFEIPVSIRGKYSITNTTSRLSITVLKEKFGKRARSTPLQREECLTIEKKPSKQTVDKTKPRCKKTPNPQCDPSKGPCYCKKC